jgi:hypothetical protein
VITRRQDLLNPLPLPAEFVATARMPKSAGVLCVITPLLDTICALLAITAGAYDVAPHDSLVDFRGEAYDIERSRYGRVPLAHGLGFKIAEINIHI